VRVATSEALDVAEQPQHPADRSLATTESFAVMPALFEERERDAPEQI